MVETSEPLRALQRAALAGHARPASWHDQIEEVPGGFLLLVANEFFDALPIRQFVKTPAGFCERRIGVDDRGGLAFVLGPARLAGGELPAGAEGEPEGTVVEISPARSAVIAGIAARIVARGGVALVIDYGHIVTGFGDTLQALKDHAFDDPWPIPERPT